MACFGRLGVWKAVRTPPPYARHVVLQVSNATGIISGRLHCCSPSCLLTDHGPFADDEPSLCGPLSIIGCHWLSGEVVGSPVTQRAQGQPCRIATSKLVNPDRIHGTCCFGSAAAAGGIAGLQPTWCCRESVLQTSSCHCSDIARAAALFWQTASHGT